MLDPALDPPCHSSNGNFWDKININSGTFFGMLYHIPIFVEVDNKCAAVASVRRRGAPSRAGSPFGGSAASQLTLSVARCLPLQTPTVSAATAGLGMFSLATMHATKLP